MDNIVRVTIKEPYLTAVTGTRYQYDYGQILKPDGIDLPTAYEVHFSIGNETITQIGTPEGVTIPDEVFLSGKDIDAYIFLHSGADDGETVYKVKIPVLDRPRPSDEEPTPVQQSAIDQAIAALNTAVEEAENSATEASGHANDADLAAAAAE